MSGTFVWRRWGYWAAHLYDASGKQMCNTHHGRFKSFASLEKRDTPSEALLSPSGLPYRKVCQRCQRLWSEKKENVVKK